MDPDGEITMSEVETVYARYAKMAAEESKQIEAKLTSTFPLVTISQIGTFTNGELIP